MQEVQRSRQLNGAYGWSLARDIADPELWTERYHCPTWLDYLRQRNRPTQSERELQQSAQELHLGPGTVRIRRMPERSEERRVGKECVITFRFRWAASDLKKQLRRRVLLMRYTNTT